MAQGRSTAVEARAACLALLLLLLLNGETVESRTYKVGGDDEWMLYSIDAIAEWAKRVQRENTITIGDKLYFQYIPGQETVMEVDYRAYKTCEWDPNAPVYRGGSDVIPLRHKNNYFISTLNDGCRKGLKLWIKASQKENA